MFDLDHFKRVNDRFGHATSDAVLVRFAALLRGAVRDRDVVARLGGEEFAVLLHSASLEQARVVCERFRAQLAGEDIVAASGASVRVTVSVGLADLATTPCDAALASADAALYTAKQSGRNRLALAA